VRRSEIFREFECEVRTEILSQNFILWVPFQIPKHKDAIFVHKFFVEKAQNGPNPKGAVVLCPMPTCPIWSVRACKILNRCKVEEKDYYCNDLQGLNAINKRHFARLISFCFLPSKWCICTMHIILLIRSAIQTQSEQQPTVII